MGAEALPGGAVANLVPGIPQDHISVAAVPLRHGLHETHSGSLDLGIGKTGQPAAVEGTVGASPIHLALGADARAAVFVEHILGGAFQKQLDDDLAAMGLGKLHQFVHIGKIVDPLLPLVPAPVDTDLKGIQGKRLHAGYIALPLLRQRRGRPVILRAMNDLIKKHRLSPLFVLAPQYPLPGRGCPQRGQEWNAGKNLIIRTIHQT